METMQNRESHGRLIFFRGMVVLVIVFILISCEPFTTSSASITNTVNANEPTTEVPSTPPILPAIYQPKALNPLDTPRTYVQDTCRYLRNKWHPANAEPGTVVMIIMFHGIFSSQPETPENLDGIETLEFAWIMEQLKKQGFEAINTKEFLAFMERNVKIPSRSVLIIQDDPHGAEYFDKYFGDAWENWKWPVVNGWNSQSDMTEAMLQENALMETEGRVDHQLQGMVAGSILSDDSSKAIIGRELENPIDPFTKLFQKTPIAIIWPGGGFGLRPVQAARELGYQLGFTANSRGPVMYNWVPLADEYDPERPAYLPDAQVKDPLMTLPRYWPYQVLDNIDTVRIMGNQAAEYAQENKTVEFEYYKVVCESTYGPIPTP